MSVRLCPRCSALIESKSAVFCYNCGQELKGGLTDSLDLAALEPTSNQRSRPVGSQGVWRQILLGLTLFLFLFLIVSLTYLKFSRAWPVPILPTDDPDRLVSTLSALPLSPFDFGKNDLSAITPAGVDYYLEGNNPKFFLDRLLTTAEKERVSSLAGLSLDEVTSFFDSNFAFVKSASASAFLSVGRDIEFLKERSQKVSGESRLNFLVVDNYYIVANSAELLAEISEVYNKTSLPLSLTSKFQEVRQKLPGSGQVFIYAKDRENFGSALALYFDNRLEADLKGRPSSSAVVTAGAGSTVLDFP